MNEVCFAVAFAIEDDAMIKYTLIPERGEDIYKTEVIMTKEIFQECYKNWIATPENKDKESK